MSDLEVGQPVVVAPSVYCHQCTYCRRQMHNHCLNRKRIGVTINGAFAEYVIAPRDVVYPIGDLPLEQAAFVEPLSCVVYALQRCRPAPGDNVLLFGAGPMGNLLTQMLRHNGAAQVVVVDRVEQRLRLAETMGASHILLANGEEHSGLHELSPRGYDFVVDATGIPEVVEGAFEHLGPRGKMLLFGVCPTKAQIRLNPYEVFRRDWRIIGSFALCYTFQEAINLLQGGVAQVEPLISHRLPLEGAEEAFTTIHQDPRRMKMLIRP